MGEDERAPIFQERPTARIAPEGWPFIAAAAALAAAAFGFGSIPSAAVLGAVTLFVVAFFRNPARDLRAMRIPSWHPRRPRPRRRRDRRRARSQGPAHCDLPLGVRRARESRAAGGRVVSLERGGARFLAAWNPRGERENVRLAMELELADGRRIVVTQITGLIARRIVCHAKVGEWLARGVRYGLIRFGSRTDVLLPPGSVATVKVGDRVRGGASILARLGAPE